MESSGLKLDISILNSDMIAKNKIQILKGTPPKLIISNEKNKELLVYDIVY